jgi:hypothetical protein
MLAPRVGSEEPKPPRRGPSALILDDIHGGDPSTWELVAYLGRNPLAVPVLFMTRSEDA